jgi:hypothetical protein
VADNAEPSYHLVYKNTGIEFLDEFYDVEGEELAQRFDQARRLLEGKLDIKDFISENSAADGEAPTPRRLAGESREHFEREWPGSGRAGADFEKVLREGYTLAIDVASERALPIETWFVTGARHGFEIHVCEGKRQVTVLMFLPIDHPEPGDHYGSRRASSRSWVVRVDGAAARAPAARTRTSGKDE